MGSRKQDPWIPSEPGSQFGLLETKPGITEAYTEAASDEIGIVPAYRQRTWRQQHLGGIKRTLRTFTIIATLVLIINVSWLGYAKAKYGNKEGFGTIRQGDCNGVKNANTWMHLAINILSTLLLTGSNAFMAAFSCPSRKEVNKAHHRGKFLHIGTFSLGNLHRISKRKGIVVLVLALSSVPFHLLYNSLVFTSLSTNEYYWSVVTEDFLTGSPFNLTGDWGPVYLNGNGDGSIKPTFTATSPNGEYDSYFMDSSDYIKLSQVMNDYFGNVQKSAPSWERLENKECIQAYSNIFQSSRRNVVLISSTQNDTNSILKYGSSDIDTAMDSNWWICSEGAQDGGYMTCNPNKYVSNASSWTVWGYPVEYCFSEKVKDVCTIQFSWTIMLVVISFNALKVIVMAWVLFRYDAEQILTSVGDAVVSFLRHEDLTTVQMCLANKREMRRFWQERGFARQFSRQQLRWGSAVSRKRWAMFFTVMVTAFGLVAFFGTWGFIHVKNRGIGLDPTSLWNMGFGAINHNALVFYGGGGNVITNAVLANLPQVILSVIYLLYLGIMSSMFLAQDWSLFAFKAQTLMVSTPAGKQRGTWLLGAPIGWGLLLFGFSTLFHWFLSQSIFVVEMSVYNKDGSSKDPPTSTDSSYVDNSSVTNCGYSPIAIIFSIVSAGILLLSAIIFMWRRFPEGAPPVVSTCSAAISAACHPVNRYEDMVYNDLMWGVDGGFSDGVGHCSLVPAEAFRTGHAHAPIEGYTYAGILEKEA